MDNQFYKKARENILRLRNQELREEIKFEAECLKYASEKLILTAEVNEEIENLKKRIEKLPGRDRWDDFARNGYRSAIQDIRKAGKYHPEQLEWLRSKERFRR